VVFILCKNVLFFSPTKTSCHVNNRNPLEEIARLFIAFVCAAVIELSGVGKLPPILGAILVAGCLQGNFAWEE
jgi:hypothetical protein